MGAKIRHGFRDRVTAGLPEDSQEAEVIRAIVIGETPPDADVLIAAFRNSGTLHAFSVSGMHVGMMGGIGWLLLARLGVPRRRAVLILLPLVFGYSWITGNSAPAVRSAWMAAVFLGAFVFRRKPDLLNALGAVLLAAMLWDGRLLFQPGVQLSYGVVAAIAVGTSWANKVFAWMAVPELYLPTTMMNRWQSLWFGLRSKAAQSLGVSLAAAVGSAPLTAWHFGMVTPVSILANLFMMAPIFILLCAALLSTALSPVLPAASRWVNLANGKVADSCVWMAERFSAIPGGHFQVRRETRPMLLVYDLDRGAGAACFSGGTQGAVLMDCGGARDFKRTIASSLRKLGIEPDAVVLSHPDGGHLGGGAPVWQAFPIRQALLPVKLARSPAMQSWVEDGPKAGVLTKIANAPASLAFPSGAVMEILHSPDPLAVNSRADDRVVIQRLHWHGWKILFTSDAGMGTERKLLESGIDLSADVIIAGRHRTDFSLSDRFLDAVRPQAIIASNSSHPPEEVLPPASVAYWKSRGIQVIDQARSGGVTLRVDEHGSLCIEGFLDDSKLLLMAR
jgi:ComEC/Rec2-related protein